MEEKKLFHISTREIIIPIIFLLVGAYASNYFQFLNEEKKTKKNEMEQLEKKLDKLEFENSTHSDRILALETKVSQIDERLYKLDRSLLPSESILKQFEELKNKIWQIEKEISSMGFNKKNNIMHYLLYQYDKKNNL